MRFYLLLHFLGVAFAVPSKANSLSIFDNPTISWKSIDSLSLPILSHVRRAGTPIMTLNMSICDVSITMDHKWYRGYDKQATFYITSGIDSPGTKNGANIFEMSLRIGNPEGPGGLEFATNEYLMNFGVRAPGPRKIDYARTFIDSTGAMRAYVDYANLKYPEANSTLKFNIEKRLEPNEGAVFGPPTVAVIGPNSIVSVTVKDQGVMTGEIIAWPFSDGPNKVYFLNGKCRNSLLRIMGSN